MLGASIPTADISQANALLAIIADPAATKQRLADIIAAQELAETKMIEAQDATNKVAERETALEAAIQQKQDEADAAVESRHAAATVREQRIAEREATVSAREAAVTEREAAADAKQAEYEDRLSKLKSAMG